MDSHAGHISVHVDNSSSGIERCETRFSSSPSKLVSYTDYLASILQEWPEYRSLHAYLLKSRKDTTFQTRVIVASADQTTINFKEFAFGGAEKDHAEAELMNLSGALQSFLQSRDPGVLFVENDGSDFHPAVIEVIGRNLDVDPTFFEVAVLYQHRDFLDKDSLISCEHSRPPISRDRGILRLHDKVVAQIITKELCGKDIPVGARTEGSNSSIYV